jgi:hypothetical protein
LINDPLLLYGAVESGKILMANNVFFVTAHSKAPKVRERINAIIPVNDRYELAENQWMVKFGGATQELAEKAGIRGGDDRIGTGLVLSVTTYSGRAPTGLWDWLKEQGF